MHSLIISLWLTIKLVIIYGLSDDEIFYPISKYCELIEDSVNNVAIICDVRNHTTSMNKTDITINSEIRLSNSYLYLKI